MKGLLAILGKPAGDSASTPSDAPSDVPPPSDSGPSEGFKASAQQAMDAISANDAAAFAEALKACIEMAGE